jgi:transforming growth factor-beta-induced protein
MMNMRKSLVLLGLVAVLALGVIPALGQSNTIVEIAAGDDRFETLVAAVTAAGLVDTLSGEGPFTVFAPTDDAFAKLPAGTVEGLLNDIPALTNILLYHVSPGEFMAADVVALDEIGTVQGSPISIEVTDAGVVLNGNANVIITDIQASNGVIHVIDTVLLPPSGEAQAPELTNSITDIAVANGSFTTLVAALGAAGLDGVLDSEGAYTVFAPTDAAFAALPAGTVDALLNDIPALTDILLYHVVAGVVPAADVVTLDNADTLNGAPIFINAADGVVLNGSVNVVTTDIQADNGIIHVIDAVLLPPTTGLRDLVLVNADTPLLWAPGGTATGGTVTTCQTALVFERLGGFGLTNFGAWINLTDTQDVAENYGQPGGQPIADQCK